MRVSTSHGSYNQRRYGKPWIAKITAWPIGGRPELQFGACLSNHWDGDAGECEIDAHVDDIIRAGQKDNRGNNTSNDWYIVEANGDLSCTNPQDARKHWDNRIKPVAVDPMDELASFAI